MTIALRDMIKRMALIIAVMISMLTMSCRQKSEKLSFTYFDKHADDTVMSEILVATTDAPLLQYGAGVAYLNTNGDTIIPFGKYAYLGTDTLRHYANVIEYLQGTYGRWMAIDSDQHILYDVVPFDNGPDYFKEGLTRVKRNGKMGFANKYGQIVIPCKYAFAWWFENGRARVTRQASQYKDYDDHIRVKSDNWFYIDNTGEELFLP